MFNVYWQIWWPESTPGGKKTVWKNAEPHKTKKTKRAQMIPGFFGCFTKRTSKYFTILLQTSQPTYPSRLQTKIIRQPKAKRKRTSTNETFALVTEVDDGRGEGLVVFFGGVWNINFNCGQWNMHDWFMNILKKAAKTQAKLTWKWFNKRMEKRTA